LVLNKKQEVRDKRQDGISIEKNDTRFTIHQQTFNIKTQSQIFGTKQQAQNNKPTAQFDKSLLKFPLMVRKWEKGDYFYPLGMKGKKKLSKYFKDEKMSLLEKENIWLLLSDNQIVWVIDKRQDERYKITSTTKQVLEISQ
jgi:tRNA(Ile)-lysidine synthase